MSSPTKQGPEDRVVIKDNFGDNGDIVDSGSVTENKVAPEMREALKLPDIKLPVSKKQAENTVFPENLKEKIEEKSKLSSFKSENSKNNTIIPE